MGKQEAIEALKKAKAVHKSNLQKVILLVKGMPLEGDAVPDSHETCMFGQWFYEDPNAQKALGGILYPEIEKLHRRWHETYHNIFALCFSGRNKPGLMKKLLGSRPKLTEEEREQALEFADELKEMTFEMTKKLDIAERRLIKLPDNCC